MTKQYTLIYILLGVLMFAISAFTAAALREANTTYDLDALKAAQTALAQQVADQVAAQESAMAAWAAEATLEVQTANTDVEALRRFTCESIVLAQVGGGTGTLDPAAVDVCMTGASTTPEPPEPPFCPANYAEAGHEPDHQSCEVFCDQFYMAPGLFLPFPEDPGFGLCCCGPL